MTEYSRNNPSPSYLELIHLYREWFGSGDKHFRGSWGGRAYKEIVKLARQTHSQTLLDYGCGKGLHFINAKMGEQDKDRLTDIGCTISGYDPACPSFDVLPQIMFDGVTVLDVMEHVPEEDVPWVLEEIFGFARKFVFFLVTTVLARKRFQDGRNVHVTIKPELWWRDKIKEAKRAARSQVKVGVFFKGMVKEREDERQDGQGTEKAKVEYAESG